MVTGPDRAAIRRFAVVFYLVLAGVGLVWTRMRTGRVVPDSLSGGDVGTSLALGLALAGVTLLASPWLSKRVPWMRWFAEEVRRLLGPIDAGTAFVLAVSSGVAEELLFRGAMQPALGYVPTSLIFGLVHTGPDRRYAGWTAFAIAMGFALGGILEATGSLTGPMLAHVLVNYVNLRRIGRTLPPPGTPC